MGNYLFSPPKQPPQQPQKQEELAEIQPMDDDLPKDEKEKVQVIIVRKRKRLPKSKRLTIRKKGKHY